MNQEELTICMQVHSHGPASELLTWYLPRQNCRWSQLWNIPLHFS